MHTFVLNLLPDRQAKTNALRHKANRKNKGEGRRKEQFLTKPHLYYQDDHADGSQQVLIVIQPFLHFLEAALK